MVKFQKLNTLKLDPEVGLFVIEANLQGVIEYDGFAEAFPKAYDLYMKTCHFNYQNKVGNILVVEEGNRKLAILFTKMKRNEKPEVVIENFKVCLKKLFQIVPSDVFLYSPILGRKRRMAPSFFATINAAQHLTNESPRPWFIFNEAL